MKIPKKLQTHSFTAKSDGLQNRLLSHVGVSLPCKSPQEQSEKNISFLKKNALWDTGATGTVISKELAQELALQPIDIVTTRGVHGAKEANVYLVNISLPNNVIIPHVRVTEGELIEQGFEVLIGMNVIALGDFAVSGNGEGTVFSFRFPSVSVIDFVDEHKKCEKSVIQQKQAPQKKKAHKKRNTERKNKQAARKRKKGKK